MGVRNFRVSVILAAVLAALAISLGQAEANITDAAAAPAQTGIADAEAAAVTVNWQVQRESMYLPNPGTISSPHLRILIGGAVVATLPRSLSRNAPGDAPNESIHFREVVRVPQALVYRAIKEGRALTFVRRFTDSFDNTFDDAEFEAVPSGDGSVALSVQRLELAFEDDTRSRVLPRGSALRVVAEIKTSGVGLLQAQWETASGASTAGTPVFRPLSLVRQGVGGRGRTVITSPPLPTSEDGTHLVRLRVLEPGLARETPTLLYYVTPNRRSASPVAQRQILLTAPRPGEPLTEETRFSWSAVPDAVAYQLAFYAAPAGPAEPLDPADDSQSSDTQAAAKSLPPDARALAGIYLSGGRSDARLGAAGLERLPGGRRILWMVTAIDANGAIIGTSVVGEIHKP